MSERVTFDYSKASCFVGDNEVEAMKKIVAAAKEEHENTCLLEI